MGDLREGEGVDGAAVCPRCGQWCQQRYPEDGSGRLVCGFCYGIGPDGTRSRSPSRLHTTTP